jgi:segregation and condensation protein B
MTDSYEKAGAKRDKKRQRKSEDKVSKESPSKETASKENTSEDNNGPDNPDVGLNESMSAECDQNLEDAMDHPIDLSGLKSQAVDLGREQLKVVIEAILMAADKAMSIDQLLSLFELHEQPLRQDIKSVLSELQLDYSGRGVLLLETGSGFSFQTNKTAASWVSRLWDERPQRYSRALLETLALIAYRQPITRGEIEDVRGVAVSSQIVKTMLERNWIRVVGHREVPGRPAIYATTRQFLDYFGLKSLDQLPPLSELRDIEAIARDVSKQLELNDMESQTGASSSISEGDSEEGPSDSTLH